MILRRTLMILSAGAVVLAALLFWPGHPAERLYWMARNHIDPNYGTLPAASLFTDTAARQAVPCPANALVLVAIGQSNAANLLEPMTSADPTVAAYNVFRGRCYVAQDPLLGAEGAQGSLWTAAAQKLAAESGRPVIVLAAAVGSTSAQQWNDRDYWLRQNLTRELALAKQAGLMPHAFLWLQGEKDTLVGTSRRAYAETLASLIASLDDKTPWFLFRASKCNGALREQGSPEIRAAFDDVARLRPNAHIVMDSDRLGDDHRSDGCHFNARGREAIVAALVPQLKARLAE